MIKSCSGAMDSITDHAAQFCVVLETHLNQVIEKIK